MTDIIEITNRVTKVDVYEDVSVVEITAGSIQGPKGDKGDAAATITVGTTTTGSPGTNASVTNSGTISDVVLNFTIPKGDKGDQGDPGIDGVNGQDGAPGAKGDKGDPGDDGAPGTDGLDGADGAPGADGADGDSAYQVAVNNGFVGTEQQWLDSLVGADGAPGAQGEPGADGAPGAQGDPGPGVAAGGTAGQILSKIDGTDYNAEWVDSNITVSNVTSSVAVAGSATGSYSTALGLSSDASGPASTALGYSSDASGQGSIAIVGNASGAGSIAIGGGAFAIGDNSIAIGKIISAENNNEIVIGNYASNRFRIPGLSLDTALANNGQLLSWSSSAGEFGSPGFFWTDPQEATPTTPGYVIGKTTLSGADTFIGFQAGQNATSPYNMNSGFGNNALSTLSYGSGNTAVGPNSLTNLNGNSVADPSDGNTALGAQSMLDLAYGSSNTALGLSAGMGLYEGSNNIFIGYYSVPSSGYVSNEIVIGNTDIDRFRIPGLGIDWTEEDVPKKTYDDNTQTASYTLVSSDTGAIVWMNVATANTVTLPTDSTFIPNGSSITIWQIGAGQTTIQGASGVTVYSAGSGTNGATPKLRSKFSSATVVKKTDNVWYVTGDII